MTKDRQTQLKELRSMRKEGILPVCPGSGSCNGCCFDIPDNYVKIGYVSTRCLLVALRRVFAMCVEEAKSNYSTTYSVGYVIQRDVMYVILENYLANKRNNNTNSLDWLYLSLLV